MKVYSQEELSEQYNQGKPTNAATPIELHTEEPQRNRVNTWQLYWFHATDPDASYRADRETLLKAGFVPAPPTTNGREAPHILAIDEYQRVNLLELLEACGYPHGHGVEPFTMYNTGDWLGEMWLKLDAFGSRKLEPNKPRARLREEIAAGDLPAARLALAEERIAIVERTAEERRERARRAETDLATERGIVSEYTKLTKGLKGELAAAKSDNSQHCVDFQAIASALGILDELPEMPRVLERIGEMHSESAANLAANGSLQALVSQWTDVANWLKSCGWHLPSFVHSRIANLESHVKGESTVVEAKPVTTEQALDAVVRAATARLMEHSWSVDEYGNEVLVAEHGTFIGRSKIEARQKAMAALPRAHTCTTTATTFDGRPPPPPGEAKAEPPSEQECLLAALLARIDRDGGQHAIKVGVLQSSADADAKLAAWWLEPDAVTPAGSANNQRAYNLLHGLDNWQPMSTPDWKSVTAALDEAEARGTERLRSEYAKVERLWKEATVERDALLSIASAAESLIDARTMAVKPQRTLAVNKWVAELRDRLKSLPSIRAGEAAWTKGLGICICRNPAAPAGPDHDADCPMLEMSLTGSAGGGVEGLTLHPLAPAMLDVAMAARSFTVARREHASDRLAGRHQIVRLGEVNRKANTLGDAVDALFTKAKDSGQHQGISDVEKPSPAPSASIGGEATPSIPTGTTAGNVTKPYEDTGSAPCVVGPGAGRATTVTEDHRDRGGNWSANGHVFKNGVDSCDKCGEQFGARFTRDCPVHAQEAAAEAVVRSAEEALNAAIDSGLAAKRVEDERRGATWIPAITSKVRFRGIAQTYTVRGIDTNDMTACVFCDDGHGREGWWPIAELEPADPAPAVAAAKFQVGDQARAALDARRAGKAAT